MKLTNNESDSKNLKTFPPNKLNIFKSNCKEEKNNNTLFNQFVYMEYSISPLENDTISINQGKKKNLYFIYCWKGRLSICKDKIKINEISPFQSALILDEEEKTIDLCLHKGDNHQFCLISLTNPPSTLKQFKGSCYEMLKENFMLHMPTVSYVFIGKPNLKLLEKINSLSRISNSKAASELIMDGLILQILGLKIEQLINFITLENKDYGTLNSKDMEQILVLSEFIKENPSLGYSIEFLCRESGLSPAKLQEGFKKMFERTVIDYIRNVRLEKATELIKETDLNISEIVYSIGLTSRSYFSKIFKKKYQCSPKYFQEQNRVIVGNE